MAKSKLIKINKKIAEKVTGCYKKIEDGVVGGFTKISDQFTDSFLTKDNETVNDAKKRLAKEQMDRLAQKHAKKDIILKDINYHNK